MCQFSILKARDKLVFYFSSDFLLAMEKPKGGSYAGKEKYEKKKDTDLCFHKRLVLDWANVTIFDGLRKRTYLVFKKPIVSRKLWALALIGKNLQGVIHNFLNHFWVQKRTGIS